MWSPPGLTRAGDRGGLGLPPAHRTEVGGDVADGAELREVGAAERTPKVHDFDGVPRYRGPAKAVVLAVTGIRRLSDALLLWDRAGPC